MLRGHESDQNMRDPANFAELWKYRLVMNARCSRSRTCFAYWKKGHVLILVRKAK
jgi:hypothetical protein